MTEPVRAADTPYSIDVEEGKAYFWCACGKSASQPFCDGSHSGTSFSAPVRRQPQQVTLIARRVARLSLHSAHPFARRS